MQTRSSHLNMQIMQLRKERLKKIQACWDLNLDLLECFTGNAEVRVRTVAGLNFSSLSFGIYYHMFVFTQQSFKEQTQQIHHRHKTVVLHLFKASNLNVPPYVKPRLFWGWVLFLTFFLHWLPKVHWYHRCSSR